jgi:RNA chaperone Hfq
MQARTSFGRDFQDAVLVRIVERGQVATIYLRNRMAVRGRIKEFDPFVLLVEPLDGTPAQLVYKSAVVSISGPPRPGGPRGPAPRRQGPGPRMDSDARGGRPGGPAGSGGFGDHDETGGNAPA